ncbi:MULTISPECIES: Lrp/AsnC family transcriptional regulator [unclassified Shewanella]|jgi:Lrp/AsnC family leucine-responsive transcriptional regulator|uniref:Lrp/AsnC family transcriptional regulator n=1 Tax=unclassified Shewanella TaxID=196818 RepID=UPI0016003AC7|nr:MULTISPECIES: Lrp/AsnC family transcriptional regulator [unclassified Shewanella]MBB1362611.1 Lrp/AsnC family transcriptional regulator [Shewanella sp. SR44-4]
MIKKPVKLDKINRNILIELQNNSRISNNELSERVGLSPSACLQRVKAMEDCGYILQYVMALDINKLCVNVKAYINIKLKSNTYQNCSIFERSAKKYPQIVDCLRVNGGIDYIAFVICTSIEEFNDFCDELLQADLGIENITSHFVLDEPKWFGGYPLNNLQWKGV